MRRTTITWPEDTVRAVERAARRRRKSVSATVRELVEKQLQEEHQLSGFEALVGMWDDPDLVPAEELEDFLKENWAKAIERDRG